MQGCNSHCDGRRNVRCDKQCDGQRDGGVTDGVTAALWRARGLERERGRSRWGRERGQEGARTGTGTGTRTGGMGTGRLAATGRPRGGNVNWQRGGTQAAKTPDERAPDRDGSAASGRYRVRSRRTNAVGSGQRRLGEYEREKRCRKLCLFVEQKKKCTRTFTGCARL